MVGDGIMLVTGSIVDQNRKPINQCKLGLLWADEKKRVSQYVVQPEFSVDFVISPFRDKYYLTIECPGYRTIFKSDEFVSRGGTYAEKPLDLGVIVMSD